jgi:small-conductance mechanosensitive channel
LTPAALWLQSVAPTSFFEHVTAARLLLVIAILTAAGLLIRYSGRGLNLLAARSHRARFVVKWLEPVLRIALWFVAIFLVFDILAPTQETFLAAVGSVAIAVGLGAQDLIKNLVGGLVVLGDRPFQLGDRVRIGAAYGEIDHVGLRSTKLTTPDDTRVTIPNADVLTQQVFNSNSGIPDALVVTDLYLPADTDADEAMRIGAEAAYTSPYAYLNKPVTVLVAHGFDRRPYLRVRVKAYVFDHRFEPQMQSNITARAQEEFRRLGMLAPWPGGEA